MYISDFLPIIFVGIHINLPKKLNLLSNLLTNLLRHYKLNQEVEFTGYKK